MFTIDSYNFKKYRTLQRTANSACRTPFHPHECHKFTIVNGRVYGEDNVIESVVAFVNPASLIPYRWMPSRDSDVCFISSECLEAVRMLIQNGMTVPFVKNREKDLIVEVEVNSAGAKINASYPMIRRTSISDRFSKNITTLDLSYYGHEPIFSDWYCRLWMPAVNKGLMSVVKSYQCLSVLNLSHNEITNLTFLNALASIDKLHTLILSHNKLTWEGMRQFPALNIRSLYIEGNPLCSTVSAAQCVTRITTIIPSVTCLDGCEIGEMECGTAFLMRNYLATNDSAWVTDQFLRHYFSFFQGNRRKDLIYMYKDDASISLSATFLPNQSTSPNTGIGELVIKGRNMLKVSNYYKIEDSFKTGHARVLQVLSFIPYLAVDRLSACIDVPYYKPNECLVVNMMCVVKDSELRDYCMDNTFVITSSPHSLGEWQIANHMVCFTNATTQQAEKAFQNSESSLKSLDGDPFEYSNEEKLAIFIEETTMNIQSCRKFLEEARWNLENAFHSFVDLYKGGLVSESSFL